MRAATVVGVVALIISPSSISQPNGKGAAVGAPTPKAQSASNAQRKDAPRERSALPVLIVQPDDDAKRTKQREDDSDQRNKDDLIAQQAAASAAEAQALIAAESYNLSKWALVLSFFSLIGFMVSLRQARKATKAAVDTIASAERAQRALVVPAFDDDREARVPRQRDGKWQESSLTVYFALENYGKSPALLREALFGVCVLKASSTPAEVAGYGEWKLKVFGNAVVRGENSSPPSQIGCVASAHEAHSMHGKGTDAHRLFFVGHVVYDDVFDRRYKREFCVRFYPSGRPQFILNTERQLAPNDPDYRGYANDADADE